MNIIFQIYSVQTHPSNTIHSLILLVPHQKVSACFHRSWWHKSSLYLLFIHIPVHILPVQFTICFLFWIRLWILVAVFYIIQQSSAGSIWDFWKKTHSLLCFQRNRELVLQIAFQWYQIYRLIDFRIFFDLYPNILIPFQAFLYDHFEFHATHHYS